jgi:hypothetical protein
MQTAVIVTAVSSSNNNCELLLSVHQILSDGCRLQFVKDKCEHSAHSMHTTMCIRHEPAQLACPEVYALLELRLQ